MQIVPVIVLFLLNFSQSAKFPPNFKKCYRKNPGLDKCLADAAQDGISQLTKPFPGVNLPNFSPLEISELTVAPGSAAIMNVDQKFKNCKLYGINTLKIDTFEFNFEKKHLTMSGVIPKIRKICEYDFDGQVLLLAVQGIGNSTIELRNTKITLNYDFEYVKKREKTYYKFTTHKLTLNPDSVSFNFENLFDGDKQLGDNVNALLNENHKEIFADIRNGYEEALGLVVLQILNNVFTKVSLEECLD